ncbi:MAG: hypothetical protein VW644_09880 [Alphaproteobacteria bacterium]
MFGAAASLKNVKMLDSQESQTVASMGTSVERLHDNIAALRAQQARQDTRLETQQFMIRDLKYRLEKSVPGSMADRQAGADPSLDIGIGETSQDAAALIADYHAAWLHAISLEAQLGEAEARQDELQRAMVAYRLGAETGTAETIERVREEERARYARLENEMHFVVSRLEEEIAQRDSSIVSLMHRLAGMQTGAPAQANVETIAGPAARAGRVTAQAK